MHLLSKKAPELPVIVVQEMGDHSTQTPRDIADPLKSLLHSKKLTEGEWLLKVNRAKIFGRPVCRGKVRLYELRLNRIIDLIVQPGGIKTRRRAQLVVPAEYNAKEVFDLLKPPPELDVAIITSNGTVLNTSGAVLDRKDLKTTHAQAKDRQDTRLARTALRFWDNPGNLLALGELLEDKLAGFGQYQGFWAKDVKAAVSKVWNSPDNFERAYGLLMGTLSDTNRHDIFVPADPLKTPAFSITEQGWVWIQNCRETKQLREKLYQEARETELRRELAGLRARKVSITSRYQTTIHNLDEQIASVEAALSDKR